MTTATTTRPKRNWWRVRRLHRPARHHDGASHKPVLPILIVFVVASALEMLVVDLIVRRWAHVRIPLLILSIWGIIFMLGLLFGMIVRPHVITAAGIRVRNGSEIDIPIAWRDVHSVTRRKHVNNGKRPKVASDDNGEASLHMRIQNETNIEIQLNQPVAIRLPHGTETLSRLNIYANDPRAFADEVRHHI
jgi:hypothetical protein